MDEIFKRENFISDIAVRSSTPSGTKTTHKEKTIIKQRDSILVFAKNKTNVEFKPQYSKLQEWDTHYSIWIQKTSEGVKLFKLVDKLKEENILSKDQSLQDININDKKFKNFYLKNADKIARWTSHKNKEIIKICLREYKDKLYITKDNEGRETIYLNKQVLQPLIYSVKDVYDGKGITKDVGVLVCDFWGDIDFQNTQNEGEVSLPAGKKPEFLLYRIIEMSTEPGDIVLDFFLGSGTTAAVVHKMGRQYIGIEQLDYGENSAIVRLKNVINGDRSGISKLANWHGGGDFIYMELMKLNEHFIEKIQDAKDKETLLSIWEEMKLNGFLSYRVDPKLFDENIEEFKGLSIDEQKRLLLETLDKNYLYVNYSEIDDEEYGVSEEDKKLNKKFYGGKEDV
jgi:adenine-specific DNA-methyltransferase